ncbi:MAG: signal peptidase I [Vampirovibrionales bacterium]
MTPTPPMPTPVPPSSRLVISEDVRELLYLAGYLATQRLQQLRKQAQKMGQTPPPLPSRPNPTVWDAWQAVTELSRLFSPLQQTLAAMGITAPQIKHLLASFPTPSANETTPDSLSLEQQLEAYWAQNHKPSTVRVDMPLALTALWHQSPAELQQGLTQLGLSPNSLQQAETQQRQNLLPGLSRGGVFRGLFLLREAVEMVVIVLVSLIVIKEGLGELRLIPSESMVPTLQIGDRLVIEKVSRWTRAPQRGDILVFYPPEPDAVLHHDVLSTFLRLSGLSSLFHNKAEDPIDKAFIKRLIGLPGDRVQIVNHLGVTINGGFLTEPYTAAKANDCGMLCYPLTVPEDHYLLMGDNRNMSKDGRYFGFLPKERIVGRAVFRVWPLNRFGPLEHPAVKP